MFAGLLCAWQRPATCQIHRFQQLQNCCMGEGVEDQMRRNKMLFLGAAVAALLIMLSTGRQRLWAQSTGGTVLLFNYVTNQANFDTHFVISNTTMDPLGTTPTPGTCTLNYYGNTNGGVAPPAQTSTTIQPGAQLAFSLSAGGSNGIGATPGFQGYVIASCGFPNGQGTITIADSGGTRFMSVVPALVLTRGSGS